MKNQKIEKTAGGKKGNCIFTKIIYLLIGFLFVIGCDSIFSPSEGSLIINSIPTGALIWLEGQETGQITNAVFPSISEGEHAIKLTKEGYMDYTENIWIKDGETVTLNVTLAAHSYNIVNPNSATKWVAESDVKIEWTTDSPLTNQGLDFTSGPGFQIQAISAVKIDLFEDSKLKLEISSQVSNTGEYYWKIPRELGAGESYSIRISSFFEPTIYKNSEKFNIYYNVNGTYKGKSWGTLMGQSFNEKFTLTQIQNGQDTMGTWSSTNEESGTFTGKIRQNIIEIIVKDTSSGITYTGSMRIEKEGDRMTGKFNGWTSYGYLNCEFRVNRQ